MVERIIQYLTIIINQHYLNFERKILVKEEERGGFVT